MKSIIENRLFLTQKMSLIYIALMLSTSCLAIFLCKHAEAYQNTPRMIRKRWKKRWKSRNTNHRNCQKSSQLRTCRRGSKCVCICEFHTYIIEDTKYCLRLFSKNIFSVALPLYQLYVFRADKHKNYCAAKRFQKGVRCIKRFFRPSFCLIIIA